MTGQDVAVNTTHEHTTATNHDSDPRRRTCFYAGMGGDCVLVKQNSTANRVQTSGHNHDDDGIMSRRGLGPPHGTS